MRGRDGIARAAYVTAMGRRVAVARLESGRAMPSTRTLQRFAEATGTRLRIQFEREGESARTA